MNFEIFKNNFFKERLQTTATVRRILQLPHRVLASITKKSFAHITTNEVFLNINILSIKIHYTLYDSIVKYFLYNNKTRNIITKQLIIRKSCIQQLVFLFETSPFKVLCQIIYLRNQSFSSRDHPFSTYRIFSNKRFRRLLNFETARCGAY